MDSKGYYKILGLTESATEDEIKKAYKRLALKYHPDRQLNKSEDEKKAAEAKFKEINEAYQVLTDPDKKRQYDSGSSFNFDPGDFNFDEFGFNSAGFNFSSFFNPYNRYRGGQTQPQQAPIQRGSDIRMNIPISIEDWFCGCTKKVKYKRNIRCTVCHGAGGTNKHTCPTCHGSGRVTKSTSYGNFGFSSTTTICPECKGKGWVVETKCPTCEGSGFKQEETIAEVKFMPGMFNGYAINYKGKGNESQDPKGETGDFNAVCNLMYDTDKYMINNNIDLYEMIKIPYYDALLGCDYVLEKPDHTKRKIKIHACTKSGKQFKLPGEGVKFVNSSADYYVIVSYDFPDVLSATERKALETIKENAEH